MRQYHTAIIANSYLTVFLILKMKQDNSSFRSSQQYKTMELCLQNLPIVQVLGVGEQHSELVLSSIHQWHLATSNITIIIQDCIYSITCVQQQDTQLSRAGVSQPGVSEPLGVSHANPGGVRLASGK